MYLGGPRRRERRARVRGMRLGRHLLVGLNKLRELTSYKSLVFVGASALFSWARGASFVFA